LYTLHEATLQHYGFVIFNQCRKRAFLDLKIRAYILMPKRMRRCGLDNK